MHLSKIKVKRIMESRGLKTFTELARCLGITKNQMSVILSDSYNPLKTTVCDLCDALSVSPFDIMESESSKKAVMEKIKKTDITNIELFAGAGG